MNANPVRDLVESGGHPFIRLEFPPDDVVHVQASGIPEQNIMPILARVAKAWAQQDLPG